MAKSSIKQGIKQTTKFAPQQIQQMKLLQLPNMLLEQRIKEELIKNPVLEEQDDVSHESVEDIIRSEEETSNPSSYMADEFEYRKVRRKHIEHRVEPGDIYSSGTTLYDDLLSQLYMLNLSEDEIFIGEQIIGNIDDNGYLTRSCEAIADDFVFQHNIEVKTKDIEHVLALIQTFEPAGIGARDLQECLLLQVERNKDNFEDLVYTILRDDVYFYMFKNKQYHILLPKLDVDKDLFDRTIKQISSLNPKPAASQSKSIHDTIYIIPDFLVYNDNGKVEFRLNKTRERSLRVSDYYSKMLNDMVHKEKHSAADQQAINFIKTNIDSANEFISALDKRDQTMSRVMAAIIKFQYSYFLEGDIQKLKPMRLEDISLLTGDEISTISRVTTQKYAQTHFGTFLLKDFFSNAVEDATGHVVAADTIKSRLKSIIDAENKQKPLPDEVLMKMLEKEGFTLARRTIAKYRTELNIPIARLRKQL